MTDKNEKNSQDIDLETTGEDNIDEPDLEEIETSSNDKLKLLRNKLKACEAEKMEHLEQAQRAKAEFLNARKRLEDEKLEAKERAVDAIIEKLVPLYDSFAMATTNEEVWNSVDENWRNGMDAIYSQLKSLLQSYNVTEVNPKGELFDPEHHEAMGHEPVETESEHDVVVKVLQVGFIRTTGGNERPVRPARVIVGNYSN